MSKICDICGKNSLYGHTISHAHNLSKRQWLPNLQKVNALVDGKKVTLRVCTSCLKAGKVQKVK
ncbi:MAG: 50S ribosomal protein L28 [candidate division Zixibacteria bacterium]|nr:50S ribosomal protein L28 [candidate division Zixibacteria bacterium]